MIEASRIVYKGGVGEFSLKKSRFIASVFSIDSEEAAMAYIEETRKRFWDATHNCFAYVVGTNNEIQRCSDDGEPSGTAGRPILDVILGEKIHNAAIVVTRYFGGTLLGTGGLVRAYSHATKEGINNSIIVNKSHGKKFSIELDYVGIGKLQYIVNQMELMMFETEYTDRVKAVVLSPYEKATTFENKITEATSGTAKIEFLGDVYYGKVNEEVVIF